MLITGNLRAQIRVRSNRPCLGSIGGSTFVSKPFGRFIAKQGSRLGSFLADLTFSQPFTGSLPSNERLKRFHPEWSPRTATVQHLVAQRYACIYSVVLPYRSIIHRLFSPSLSSWGRAREEKKLVKGERSFFLSFSSSLSPSFFLSSRERVREYAVCILICSS